jgi:FKBP-type peptidyl-prolyl cis-trans isomerase
MRRKSILGIITLVFLLSLGCGDANWRKYYEVAPGFGFKYIEKATHRPEDSLVWWNLSFRFTDVQDSLLAESDLAMDITPLNQTPDPYDLRQVLQHAVVGDSLVVQMDQRALAKQPFASALQGIAWRPDSLLRLHIRVESALDAAGWEEKSVRENAMAHRQAMEAFVWMVKSNEQMGPQRHVPMTTYVKVLKEGKGREAKAGESVVVHMSMVTSYGLEIINTQGQFPIPVTIMGGDVPIGVDVALAGMKVGAEHLMYVPFTENNGSALFGERIQPYDNLRVQLTLVDIVSPE